MPVEVRINSVAILPLDGKLHASVRCKKCSHKKNIYEELSDEKLQNFKKGAYCSKCRSRDFSINIFQVQKKEPAQTKYSSKKKCIVCDEEISEQTLFSLPHTKCCSKHLDHNPTVIPKLDEPLGTREDFKRDSASNWVRSKSSKFWSVKLVLIIRRR